MGEPVRHALRRTDARAHPCAGACSHPDAGRGGHTAAGDDARAAPEQAAPVPPRLRPGRRTPTPARPTIAGVRVAELWRYPVKSLQGERLDAVRVTADGLEGDRRYAIFDLETGFGLTARRRPELLFASARLGEDGGVEITLPGGAVAADDTALSAWLGRPVTLRRAAAGGDAPRRFENVEDPEDDAASAWSAFVGAGGTAFHDEPEARVSLVSRATIAQWDPRRFRSNVLLDGEGEEALVGSRATLGEAVLDVGMRIQRCVMVTRPQPGGIERDLTVLRTVARERDACLAVGALVAEPGVVRVGDALTPDASQPYRAPRPV